MHELLNTKDILKNVALVSKQLTVAIDFHSMEKKKNNVEVNGYRQRFFFFFNSYWPQTFK